MNCNKCGKFMKLIADWDEFPLGPYVNTEYKCICGSIRIHSDDFRLKLRGSASTARKDK